MKTFKALLPLLAVFVAASPSLAEPPTGSRVGERLKPLANPSFRDTEKLAQRTAQCAATLYQTDAKKVFSAKSADSRSRARAALGAMERCSMRYLLGNEGEVYSFKINPPIYDGMLAEELVKDRKVKQFVPSALQEDYDRSWFGMTGRPIALDDMAVCTVYVAPNEVLALFDTDIKSTDEKAAISKLSPAMGQCLQQDVELQADVRSIRAALGEAMYRRIIAPKDPSNVKLAGEPND